MGTVTTGFDARLANRPFLVLTFGHSAYSESVRRWGHVGGGAVSAPPNYDGET